MGLAASQARFLGLTARKSNIEYEGQQVNQQRTALAEEVNSLYNQLLGLNSPIAPDTTQFYESNYSFEFTNTQASDGTYLVKSYYENADGTYTFTTERSYKKQVAVGELLNRTTNPINYDEATSTYSISGIEDEAIALTKMTEEDSAAMIAMINEAYPDKQVISTYLYSYKDANGLTHYIDADSIENDTNEEYSIYSKTQKDITETVVFENATVTYDQNNRISSVNIPELGQAEVDTTRTYDTQGYDAALRDYTMSKDEYDKKVADINAQTESLQQEDKVLELRLNQIDTEQQTLQTELDAVKTVLKENIEKTFNTFSG